MDKLITYRKEIDKIDSEILRLMSKRFAVVKKVGHYKKKNNLPVVDKSRERILLNVLGKKAEKYKLEKKFIKKIWKILFREAYKLET